MPSNKYHETMLTQQLTGKNAKEFTQYTKQGHGYAPCSKTYASLPAGFYKLEMINGVYFLVKHELISDSIIELPDSDSAKIIAEIDDFWAKSNLFQQYGLSHKRGVLLYGPPGSGKTVTALVIAKNVIENGGLVFQVTQEPYTLTQMLPKVRQVEPDRPVVIIMEDIDSLIKEYSESEVLSLLDGEQSIDNVVYVATTNYPEELDKRVTDRPSRFDRLVKIDFPSYESRISYLLHHNVPDSKLWGKATEGFSIAHIKELIVSVKCLGHDFETELKRLRSMYKTPKNEFKSDKVGF